MNRRALVVLTVLAAFVAACAALLVTRSAGSPASGPRSTLTSSPAPTDSAGSVARPVVETGTVTVSGTPLAPFDPTAKADPAVGVTAPLVSGVAFDGTAVGPVAGHATLWVFFAHWCPHCNVELPRLREWFDRGDVPAGLDVIGVSSAANAQRPNYPPSRWLDGQMHWPWPVIVDSEKLDALRAFGVGSFPTVVVVGADGTVKGRIAGEVALDALDTFVRAALRS